MTSLKMLSAAAVMALMLPLAEPTASFAQGAGYSGGPASAGGGSPGPGYSGAPIPGVARDGGGPGYSGAPIPSVGRGGGGPGYSGAPRHWQGGGHRHRYGGYGTGLVVGGALGSPGYGYYDDGYYYDEPVVAVGPGAVEYCKRRFKSYDVRSGTYLGNDRQRHACP